MGCQGDSTYTNRNYSCRLPNPPFSFEGQFLVLCQWNRYHDLKKIKGRLFWLSLTVIGANNLTSCSVMSRKKGACSRGHLPGSLDWEILPCSSFQWTEGLLILHPVCSHLHSSLPLFCGCSSWWKKKWSHFQGKDAFLPFADILRWD